VATLVQASPTGMLLVDHAGLITLVNAEAERLLGYALDELLGQSVEALLPDMGRIGHARRRAGFLAEPAPRRMGSGREVRAVRRDGHELSVEIGLARIETPGGVFVLATLTDVGERKRVWRADEARTLARRLVQSEEAQRKRMAREIHDSLGQALTALKLDIVWLAQHLPDEPASLHLRAIEMEELATRTIDDVRRLSAELRPTILDDQGLLAAIRWQVGDFEKRYGLRCTVALPDAESALGADRSTEVFRVLQESLTNVARHAQARRVDVTLCHGPQGDAVLLVRDDGCGFSQEQATLRGGLGLLGMRERAELHGGSLTVTTMPGTGTTLSLRMPCEPAAILGGSALATGREAAAPRTVNEAT
jgi:PAS domain S-box-containing protein